MERAIGKLTDSSGLAEAVRLALEDGKAEDIVVIDLEGRSSVTDILVIASGRSDRQVVALADRVDDALRAAGAPPIGIEGKTQGDWVLIDAVDIVVHIFRPEVRSYYNLEKMWGAAAFRQAGGDSGFDPRFGELRAGGF